MEKIASIAELDAAIAVLQAQREREEQLLRQEFFSVTESLKPINILKSTFRAGTSSPGFYDGILGAVAGIAVGSLSRNILVGSSTSFFRKLLGSAVQLGISGVIGRNTSRIKAYGKSVVQRIFKRNRASSVTA
jgi:hypothetical protein